MELLRLGVDISQQHIVRDDVLDEGRLVVLLLVVGLGSVERHHGHGAQRGRHLVLAFDKGGVIELGTPVGQRTEGLSLVVGDSVFHGARGGNRNVPAFADAGQLAAGYHHPVSVDHTHGTVDGVFHLENDTLEHPARHSHSLLIFPDGPGSPFVRQPLHGLLVRFLCGLKVVFTLSAHNLPSL